MPWCEDGHFIRKDDKFCSLCGSKRITKCKNGHELRPFHDDLDNETRPEFCYECGEPFNWPSD
jgi:hypothetical protein